MRFNHSACVRAGLNIINIFFLKYIQIRITQKIHNSTAPIYLKYKMHKKLFGFGFRSLLDELHILSEKRDVQEVNFIPSNLIYMMRD